MAVWKSIQDSHSGFCYDLSQSLAIVDWRHSVLEPVRDSSMVLVSDYSGQHKGSSHEAYSFLVTTMRAIHEWLPAREAFRREWLKDGRRISFKQLGDSIRWRAFAPFLGLASALRGNLITILVDRRIKSFVEGRVSSLVEIMPDCFSANTSPKTMEKMLRLASFVAMITADLRNEHQPSSWISDHDETLETFDRREQLGRLACYFTFAFAGWREPADMWYGTTEASDLPSWAEDAAAIPDLIAGAACKLAFVLPTHCGTELWTRTVSTAGVHDRRARIVGDWLAARPGHLRQILLRLELSSDGQPRASAQFFAGATRVMHG